MRFETQGRSVFIVVGAEEYDDIAVEGVFDNKELAESFLKLQGYEIGENTDNYYKFSEDLNTYLAFARILEFEVVTGVTQ